jgi:hypothetical protein
MNKRTYIMLAVSLALIVGTAAVLGHFRSNRRLGEPGVKTSAIEGSPRLKIELPERVLDYTSEWTETDEMTLNVLPQDTSFGNRLYKGPDGFEIRLQAVMMGTDRTSIHKPEFCLRGMGLQILKTESETVFISAPKPYEMAVTKMTVAPEKPEHAHIRGLYVFWFVADDALTADHEQRMWWMARHLLKTGELQRWTYMSCFAQCLAGQEDAAFGRMQSFIAEAVPQFQMTPKAPQIAGAAP